jgi:hypothetical protein
MWWYCGTTSVACELHLRNVRFCSLNGDDLHTVITAEGTYTIALGSSLATSSNLGFTTNSRRNANTIAGTGEFSLVRQDGPSKSLMRCSVFVFIRIPPYRVHSYNMRQLLIGVEVIKHGARFKQNITLFAQRLRYQKPTAVHIVWRNQLLQDWGFGAIKGPTGMSISLSNSVTVTNQTLLLVFLDSVLLNNRGEPMADLEYMKYIKILAYIGVEHLRLPITLEAYDRCVPPDLNC